MFREVKEVDSGWGVFCLDKEVVDDDCEREGGCCCCDNDGVVIGWRFCDDNNCWGCWIWVCWGFPVCCCCCCWESESESEWIESSNPTVGAPWEESKVVLFGCALRACSICSTTSGCDWRRWGIWRIWEKYCGHSPYRDLNYEIFELIVNVFFKKRKEERREKEKKMGTWSNASTPNLNIFEVGGFLRAG